MNENPALNHYNQHFDQREKNNDDNPTEYVEKDYVDDEGARNFNLNQKSEFNLDVIEETNGKNSKVATKEEEEVEKDSDLDATKLYLHDIGKLELLTKKEESILGRQIEIGDRISELSSEFEIKEDSAFNSKIVAVAIKLACSKFKLVQSLLKILKQPSESSLMQLANNEEFRDKIDSYFDEELINKLSQKLNETVGQVEQQIRELSIDMQIVPEDVLYIIDKASLKTLFKETNKAKTKE